VLYASLAAERLGEFYFGTAHDGAIVVTDSLN
jgi:hypothetical protein